MKHVISVLVENKFGVLARISGLFSARGFNIDSLVVGETEDPTISRMTIVVRGDDRTIEQVMKQLHKLIDVITVFDLTKKDYTDRELVLVKVSARPENKSRILELVDTFKAQIADTGKETITIEATGNQEKVAALLESLKAFGIKEISRTGRIAITKD